MRTIDNKSEANVSFLQKLSFDLRLLGQILAMLFLYLTKGRRIRKAYRQYEAQGKIYWIDEQEPPEKNM